MIANKTTVDQTPKDVDESNSRPLHSLKAMLFLPILWKHKEINLCYFEAYRIFMKMFDKNMQVIFESNVPSHL